MMGCSAKNCSNSHAKEFVMVRFPRDKVQREKWRAAVGGVDWNPTPTNRLCEAHFERNQWEKFRCRLKKDEVPTLFCKCIIERPTRRARRNRSLSLSDAYLQDEQIRLGEHSYCSHSISDPVHPPLDHTSGTSTTLCPSHPHMSRLSSFQNTDHPYIKSTTHLEACYVPPERGKAEENSTGLNENEEFPELVINEESFGNENTPAVINKENPGIENTPANNVKCNKNIEKLVTKNHCKALLFNPLQSCVKPRNL